MHAQGGGVKVLLCGDTHFPFSDEQKLNRLIDKVDYHHPDVIVQLGDLYDFYSFSRYDGARFMTPTEELQNGRGEAESFWEAMRIVSPKARKIQLLGNHDDRMLKKVRAKAPELESVLEALDYQSLWRFKGVETQPDSRTEIVIESPEWSWERVMLQHGHRGKLGDHVKFNQECTAVGHSHKGGVIFHRLRGKTLWELNAGYIADQRSRALSYTAQQLSDSVPGYGIIDNDGPRFIPL
jgi:predicted phosphodiesterase